MYYLAHRRRALRDHSADIDDDSAEDSDSSDESPSHPAESDGHPRTDEPEETPFTKEEMISVGNIKETDPPEEVEETSPRKAGPAIEDTNSSRSIKSETVSSPKRSEFAEVVPKEKTTETLLNVTRLDGEEPRFEEGTHERSDVAVKLEQEPSLSANAHDHQEADVLEPKVHDQLR